MLIWIDKNRKERRELGREKGYWNGKKEQEEEAKKKLLGGGEREESIKGGEKKNNMIGVKESNNREMCLCKENPTYYFFIIENAYSM